MLYTRRIKRECVDVHNTRVFLIIYASLSTPCGLVISDQLERFDLDLVIHSVLASQREIFVVPCYSDRPQVGKLALAPFPCIVEGNEMHLGQVPITCLCHWEIPFCGTIDLLHMVRDDDAFIKEDFAKLVLPFSTLWRDLHRLLPPGEAAEYRRCLISQVISASCKILHLKESVRSMESKHAIRLL